MSAEETPQDAAPGLPAVALFQPDIAGNTGTILRTAACLGFAVHVIGPAGFDLSDRALRRAGLDYLAMATLVRHDGWTGFDEWRRAAGRRLVLFTTKAETSYLDLTFASSDVLLLGRESAGVPTHVHDAAGRRVTIPMRPGTQSLNLAVAVGMAAGEAMRCVTNGAERL